MNISAKLKLSASKSATSPSCKTFDDIKDGEDIQLFELRHVNDSSREGMTVWVTNYGARIVRWMAPDRDGRTGDIVLGYDSLSEYVNSKEPYHGAIIGRHANRIARGRFVLDGDLVELTLNEGVNHLHGGTHGFHDRTWKVRRHATHTLSLDLISMDGDEGYPGTVKVRVTYEMAERNVLDIKIDAVTDAPTFINLTSHPYFNLAGPSSGSIEGHELMIPASTFVPVDDRLIPTGEVRHVEGSPFDFRRLTAIGDRIHISDEQLIRGRGYDHYYLFHRSDVQTMRHLATIIDRSFGRRLDIHSTEPGLQFYSGNMLDGSDMGREGVPHGFRSAFCIEPQHAPDGPNQPTLPSFLLLPNRLYSSRTRFSCSTIAI